MGIRRQRSARTLLLAGHAASRQWIAESATMRIPLFGKRIFASDRD
ncbi:hypothetical protein BSIN_1666 [Burkholderia singularis]|uniref:Uncharacterized protein n=1 Tax=Burkholderia singularis TaxID=1503053 RepID=A0A238GZL2_9BURK|nr:hypothetical protein BSIN_1666 [Burkholderia singularis]